MISIFFSVQKIEREIKKAQQLEAEKLKEKQQYEREYKEKLKQVNSQFCTHKLKAFSSTLFFQLEVKENLEEYKKQKLELNEYIEMEQYIKEETQRELRKQQAKFGIINFQQRVFYANKKKIFNNKKYIT